MPRPLSLDAAVGLDGQACWQGGQLLLQYLSIDFSALFHLPPPSLPCLLISTLSRLILFLSVHICVFFVSIPLYHFHLRVKIINCLTIGCLVDSLNSNSGNHKSGSGLLLRGIAFESRRVEEEEEYSLASRYSLTACGRTSAARRSACCSCVVLRCRAATGLLAATA